MEERTNMDIFEVLTAISKRKKAFIHTGINENEALMKAEFKKLINCRYLFNKYYII